MVKIGSYQKVKLTLKLTNFLSSKETRPGSKDHSRLHGTQPKLPHQEILHEGDHELHWQPWHSKLKHLFNLGPNFRIFAAGAT